MKIKGRDPSIEGLHPYKLIYLELNEEGRRYLSEEEARIWNAKHIGQNRINIENSCDNAERNRINIFGAPWPILLANMKRRAFHSLKIETELVLRKYEEEISYYKEEQQENSHQSNPEPNE